MAGLARALTPILLALAMLLAPATVRPVRGAVAELTYLALGDSVPSGTDLPDGLGYPTRLGQQIADASGRTIRLLNRSRSGEQSSGVLANQLAELREIQPELVTVTVGANDFLVPGIECASAATDRNPDTQCSGTSLLRAVPTFERNFRTILNRLVNETGATIVVTTYFNPFPRGSRCAPATTDAALRYLNRTIMDVAGEFGDRNVVVDIAPIFKGHEGREPSGWFSPGSSGFKCADIHPNAAGHDAIAEAILDALAPRLALAR